MKVNPQAHSMIMNNKEFKSKESATAQQNKEASQAPKVEELKELVAKGEYKIDLDQTATAMINEFVR